jgi:diguanylate cyclase (GGDEF)-like protein
VSAPPQRLLVVEDDPEMCYLLASLLGRDGREVLTAELGAQAAERLARGDIDLVVLDLILPDMDGRTLLGQMRARPETAVTPVVVVTARSGEDIRQDCYALGADAFTEKPFDAEAFAEEVDAVLGRSTERRRASLRDHLSGLLNRAGLHDVWDGADVPPALGLVQLDGFMSFVERCGWSAGEQVVRDLAGAVSAAAGDVAKAAHMGGGEFVLVAAATASAALADIAEDVLAAVRTLPLTDPAGDPVRLTATVAVLRPSPQTSLEEALEAARRRIFQTRERGWDRVVADDPEPGTVVARVLVAEDDEISATILLHRLQKEGLEVVRFDDGQQAYEAALRDVPDLVILDVKMPGMDGFEVLERLRGTAAYAGVPIIMLTSMGREADVVRGFELGADDYILKPFSPVELAARVRRLLARGRSPSAV